MPERLPIYDVEDDILDALRAHRRVVVSAPTGSGKSTQVPQMLLDQGLLGDGQVIVLQPRRLATRLLAARVAKERRMELGLEVGYQIRLENVSRRTTRIKYVTEGILLRRIVTDPELQGITAILFDEFHERHLYGDVTLARAMQIQAASRPDLQLVVMSATLHTGPLMEYLAPCPLVESTGRTFPVETRYLDRNPDPKKEPVWEQAAKAFEKLMASDAKGDTLVFMPGAYEIRRTVDAIQSARAAKGMRVMPLHGELAAKDQDAAVAAYDQRKVVVATNVAETSITIDGVRNVIDAGLARVADFDPHRGINTLHVRKISRASADQRAGRAGRTAPGICVRLWTERKHAERPLHDAPEIHRLDLSEVTLTLKTTITGDLRKFSWLDPPQESALARAESLLADLGALHPRTGEITDLGRRMQSFPLHPRYARMLLSGDEFGCTYEAALIAALTQGRSLLIRNPGKPTLERRLDVLGDPSVSDFLLLMRAYAHAKRHGFRTAPCQDIGIHAQSARQVTALLDAFLRSATHHGLTINDLPATDESIQRCVLVGFVDQLAKRLDGGTLRCDLIHGRRASLSRDSVVRDHPLLVAAEISEIQGRDREMNVLLNLATAVEEDWLSELFPGESMDEETVAFDATGKRVVAVRCRRFRDLILERKPGGNPHPDQAAELLAGAVLDGRFVLKQWTSDVDQWIYRLNGLSQWMPELELPTLTDEDRLFLVQQICHGCFSAKEIRDRPIWATLKAWLRPGQQDLLDRFAPERFVLPGGRKAKVQYRPDGAPHLAARIQDLYGVEGALRIADRRIALVIEILAPNHRPVQVTDDLSRFWKETYPKVKQEMQRKYPKHEWR